MVGNICEIRKSARYRSGRTNGAVRVEGFSDLSSEFCVGELRCRSCRTHDMPPFLFREVSIAAGRDAYLAALRRCPPNSTSFVGGRPRDDFGTVVRFWAPSCNSLPYPRLLIAKRQRGVGARVSPLSREASDGGAKTRRLTLASARRPNESALVHHGRRVLGGGMFRVLHNLQRRSLKHNSLPNRKLPTRAAIARGPHRISLTVKIIKIYFCCDKNDKIQETMSGGHARGA